MALTNLVTLRISSEERLLYEKEAAYRNQGLSSYLRERLKRSEPSSQELQKIYGLLKSISSTPSSSHDQGILLETLLLLRYLSSPKKVLLVQKELKRLNIPVWKGDNFSKE